MFITQKSNVSPAGQEVKGHPPIGVVNSLNNGYECLFSAILLNELC